MVYTKNPTGFFNSRFLGLHFLCENEGCQAGVLPIDYEPLPNKNCLHGILYLVFRIASMAEKGFSQRFWAILSEALFFGMIALLLSIMVYLVANYLMPSISALSYPF